MKEKYNIEDVFKEAFENWEVDPPRKVKETIDSSIQKDGTQRTGFYIISALLLLFVSSLAYYFLNTNPKNKQNEQDVKVAINKEAVGKETIKLEEEDIESAEKQALKKISKSTETEKTNGTKSLQKNKEEIKLSTERTVEKTSFEKELKSIKHSSTISGNKLKKKEELLLIKERSFTKEGFNQQKNNTQLAKNEDLKTEISTEDKETSKEEEQESIANELEKIDAKKTEEPKKKKVPNKDSLPSKPAISASRIKLRGKGNWSIGLVTGPTFGKNRLKNNLTNDALSEKSTFNFQVQVRRKINSDFSIQLSPMWNKQDETALVNFKNQIVTDGDTITTNLDLTRSHSISVFSFPLSIGWRIPLASQQFHFIQEAFGGVSYRKVTETGIPNSSQQLKQSKIGGIVGLKSSVYYQFNNVMFSTSFLLGYDLKPVIVYPNFERSRWFFTPQIGIHWMF